MPNDLLQGISDIMDELSKLDDLIFGFLEEQAEEESPEFISAEEFDRILNVSEKIHFKLWDLLERANMECENFYWRGFGTALKRVNRQDLLVQYPKAKEATKILEAFLERERKKPKIH